MPPGIDEEAKRRRREMLQIELEGESCQLAEFGGYNPSRNRIFNALPKSTEDAGAIF